MRPVASHEIALLFASALAASGCGIGTDAATRLAYDLEAGADRLGQAEGSHRTVSHATPSKAGDCDGPYRVQLDRVGALVVWCKDAAGHTVASHSTSYHARFVTTPNTYLLDKPAGSTLVIELERRGGQAVIADVR